MLLEIEEAISSGRLNNSSRTKKLKLKLLGSVERKKLERERKRREEERIRLEKEKQERLNARRGYKDIKFGMSLYDVRTRGFCDQWRITKHNWIYKGKKCYKVAGKKRDFFFIFSKHRYKNFVAKEEMDAYAKSSRLEIIMIDFGMYDNSFFNVLKKSLKKKYKLEYELSDAAMIRNNLAKMIFYDEGRVSLIEDNIDGKMYIQYSDNPAKEYIKFLPNKLKKIDSSEL